ncbi:ABC transporter substrate-binding protein [Xinfangfangia sp. CPCC 101601]|uniref:ABC transporter substrate-binding protein n=1 Tax=Pseudogemmobacter lacusdianii TaxID=3069608 RepID=A0ABU0W1I0_9RHOB|nr:ABC transporter substrate-binding protein [Xinfangfangia sp. CPCC 101601]MDQ2067880.1 ABC transporter substrate-binding protein [Xinfangfangia sp. CPCC 101601]
MSRHLRPALLAAPFALLASSVLAEPITLSIANFGEHPQLNAVADGFKAEILASGMVEGTDVVFTLDHVNFDTTLLPQMIAKIDSGNPALVLAITTPVSQNVKNQMGGKGIPLLYSAVTDPVAAGLAPSWEAGEANMSGATDALDLDAALAFARALYPEAKTFGVPFNPAEANDVATVELFKTHAATHGFEIIAIGIDNTNDIQPRIAALAGQADVLYGPGSSLIQPAISAVAAAANEVGIPLINTDPGLVHEGVIPAAFGVSYEQIGHLAGRVALRALKGEDLAAIPPQNPAAEDHSVVISRKAMEALGLAIPASFDGCDCIVD